jgi:hypothetical protein
MPLLARKLMVRVLIMLALSASGAYACDLYPTLREAVNAADQLVKDGNPASAIVCYRNLANSELFKAGPVEFQERMLFEYVAVSQKLTKNIPAQAVAFHELAVDAADLYVSWYGDLPDEDLRQLQHRGQQRPGQILLYRANSQIALKNQVEMLDSFQDVAQYNPEFFTPNCVALWINALSSYPEFNKKYSAAQIRKMLVEDGSYKFRWTAFRNFLESFKSVKDMQNVAKETAASVQHLMGS